MNDNKLTISGYVTEANSKVFHVKFTLHFNAVNELVWRKKSFNYFIVRNKTYSDSFLEQSTYRCFQ